MPRRRRFLERPHVHLHAAAKAHERLHSDDGDDAETAAELDGEAPANHQADRARAQRRGTGGKFA